MTPDTTHPPIGTIATTGSHHPPLQEWVDIVDAALHGIHHSLNNRIGSLSAVADLLQTGGLSGDAATMEGMAAEVDRLQQCNRVVHLLSSDGAPGEEAMDVNDVLADALHIHRFLPASKELAVEVASSSAHAVRAERWALFRALVLLLATAKSAANQGKDPSVSATTNADATWVRVEFRFRADERPGDATIALSPYAVMLAERFGGAASRTPGAIELRMPTLKARRAADRR